MNSQPILIDYKQRAIDSYRNTSFSPERRGEDLIADYSQELDSDIKELNDKGIDSEIITDYENRYKRLFSGYLGAKSNTFSVMITGGGNFPVKRHEKANRSEKRHYEIFREWRKKAKAAIVRKSLPKKTNESEILRYKSELESMKANHELMKQGNKILSSKSENKKAEIKKIFPSLSDFDMCWLLKYGFGLANNLANIKRVEARINELEAKETKKEKGNKETDFDDFVVIENYDIDRLQIKHSCKPSQDIIMVLKKNGYKWSPSNQCWQRQLTQNAIWSFNNYFLPSIKKINN